MIIKNNTPIQKFQLNGFDVFVKREDLATEFPAPKLAKLRGVYIKLKELKEKGTKILGVLDTRISKSGWGVAYLAKEMGFKVYAFYPKLKSETELQEQQKMAKMLGAVLVGMKAGRTGVLYGQAKVEIERIGGYMLPMGLTLPESIKEISREAKTIPKEYLGGDLVLSVGSGMSIAGIADGIADKMNFIYGISAGMNTKKQRNRILKESGHELPKNVRLIRPAGIDYYSEDNIFTPFPSSVYYDKKAWRWLSENITKLKQPILFWNIGQ